VNNGDVMVNNAGIAPGVPPFLEMSDSDFARTIETNLYGTFRGCRAAARVKVTRGAGSIINMSSIPGRRSTWPATCPPT
jgi:NAD(P)-dependent dehydrogenase (short-subunit alcohol dehydrogenase family)